MQCMRADCQSRNLLYSTCNSRTVNLLAGDILKVTKYSNIMSKVMSVQKDFKKTGLENCLMETCGRKPVLFSTTRWVNQRNAAESFLKNLSAMKKVAADCDADAEVDKAALTPKPGVSSLLFNANFCCICKNF